MRNLLFTLILSVAVSATWGQSASAIKLQFNPGDSLEYQLLFDGTTFKLDIVVAGLFHRQNDTIQADWIIRKYVYSDGTADEKAYNQEYQQKINTRQKALYNNCGTILSPSNTQKEINTNLLIAGFPATAIKPLDTWQVITDVEPDVIFDSIAVRYTCAEITATETRLDVQMNFLEGKTPVAKGIQLTKRYDGFYLIDNKTGVVKYANLKISGFNGFSGMSGSIVIQRIQ